MKSLRKKKNEKTPTEEKNPVGRPTKDSDTKRRIIIETLKEFPYLNQACKYAKIHRDTLRNWREKDPDFSSEIDFAIAIGIKELEKLARLKEPWKLMKAADNETFRDKYEIEQESHHTLLLETGDEEEEDFAL